MSLNGSGVFLVNSTGQPVVSNTLILASVFNAFTADVATALSTAVYKDGQQSMTANLPMNGYKLTGVGAATARTDAATLATIQDNTGVYVATVGGTADAITLTPSPAITAYAAGQRFSWIASGANTGAVTVNVNSLGAKALTKNGSTALIVGDIVSGAMLTALYDGTRFQLVGYAALPLGGGTVTGTLAVTGTITGSSTISTSGSIGAGTNSPSQKIHAHTAAATDTYIRASNSAASGGFDLGAGSDGNAYLFSRDNNIVIFGQNNTERMRIAVGGNVGIGGISPSVKFAISGTDAILIPVGTTAQRPSGASGYLRFNSSLTAFEGYNGSGWFPLQPTNATKQASTSGTSIDFTSIPSGVTKITVMLSGVSTNGTSDIQLQLGSGSVETSGYNGALSVISTGVATLALSAGFKLTSIGAAAYVFYGAVTLTLLDAATNLWVCSGNTSTPDYPFTCVVAGSKALSGVIDRVRITTAGGTDTFDAGSINIQYQ